MQKVFRPQQSPRTVTVNEVISPTVTRFLLQRTTPEKQDLTRPTIVLYL